MPEPANDNQEKPPNNGWWIVAVFVIAMILLLLVMLVWASAEEIAGRASVIDGDTIEIHGQRIQGSALRWSLFS